MSDPLSAMMNFISDVNPLASVFKSPDGASPDASPPVTHANPRDLATDALLPANRQASRALRRRPAGIRPGPPRVGEREFAVRHPQPPQRGVDARHRQREGDATARGGEGARPFHSSRFLDRRLFFKRGPRLGAARHRRDPGAVHPETARTRPGSRRSRATRGDGRVRPRDRRRGGGAPRPSIAIVTFLGTSTARNDAWRVLLGKIATDSESRFYGNASWHVPRALFFSPKPEPEPEGEVANASDRPDPTLCYSRP